MIAVLGNLTRWMERVRSRLVTESAFPGSAEYWRERYAQGKTSGAGSYNHLAAFKAEILNQLVQEQRIQSVIEFGCGDGNQLTLASYPRYLGFDVSAEALARCRSLFAGDTTKQFALLEEIPEATAELTLSLDVVYHLVEDPVFQQYMERLFDSAERVVVVYSSNYESGSQDRAQHVRHREFTRWVAEYRPAWTLKEQILNRYPFQGDNKQGSHADFFVYERAA